MGFITQLSPVVLVGVSADRPLPARMPIGSIFHATDTGETQVMTPGSESSPPSWQQLSGGDSYKFSGGFIIPESPLSQTTFWFADALVSNPDFSDTSSIVPIDYDVALISGHQVLGVRVIFNTLAFESSISMFRNGSGEQVVNIPAGFTGRRSAPAAAAFAAGDALSVGLTISGSEITPGNGIAFTAVVTLAP